jgi:hypothetical protein
MKNKIAGYAIIDVGDLEKCKPYKWRISAKYVLGSKGARNSNTLLHHLVCGTKHVRGVLYIDHRNSNPLDNRRDNLRPCTNSENACNRGKASNNVSGYKGVHWRARPKRWEAEIGHKRIKYRLGMFKTKEEAALAYNKKALELHGEFAYQNIIVAQGCESDIQ